jgi:hypothetical protein
MAVRLRSNINNQLPFSYDGHGIITGMKRRAKIIIITVLAAIFAIAVSFGAVWAISSYLNHQYASLHDGCYPNQTNHTIVVKDDKAIPSATEGKRCDTLTVTNLDDESREMAFGLHEKHTPYDGVTEKVLAKGESFTVTLVQTGNFKVHDHEHDEVQATFEVK